MHGFISEAFIILPYIIHEDRFKMSDDSFTNLSSSRLLNSDDDLEFMKAR